MFDVTFVTLVRMSQTLFFLVAYAYACAGAYMCCCVCVIFLGLVCELAVKNESVPLGKSQSGHIGLVPFVDQSGTLWKVNLYWVRE